MRILKSSCIVFVKTYRFFVAPLFVSFGVRCRFSPSCSEYALEALQRHGTGRALALVCYRLLRCHPLCKGGHDPVPPLKMSWENRNG